MSYENLRQIGTLTAVCKPTLVERISFEPLVFPEQLHLTRVQIDIKDSRSTFMPEIYGVVPEEWVGKEVELVSSYHDLPHQQLFMQEFYVEGQRVINQATVRRK